MPRAWAPGAPLTASAHDDRREPPAGGIPAKGPGRGRRAAAALVLLTLAGVFGVEFAQVGVTNFGGADEWLYLDLTSRGVLGIPYANRPLVLLWHALPAWLLPGDLRGFWLFTGFYVLLTGALTVLLARRLAPEAPLLGLTAGVFACCWAPLDYLRLDTVLICGYAGFTLASMAAVVVFVEAWSRRRAGWLGVGIALGLVAALGVESVLPVLAVAPLIVAGDARREPGRFARWALAWAAGLVVGASLTLGPLLLGRPAYQTGALGFDPWPPRVVGRLVQLLSMQAAPLLTSAPSELAVPAVWAGVALFLAGGALLAVRHGRAEGCGYPPRGCGRLAFIGAALAVSAHLALAFTPQIRTPARTQVLSAPGFGLALAALVGGIAGALPRRWRSWATLALGSWVVAVGTGRVAAMQAEWDEWRSAYPRQRQALASLVDAVPALEGGTLVLLLDGGRSFPIGFTFRHALAYLYGPDVVGVVPGTPAFLYPWRFTADGVTVEPWPAIRGPWGVDTTRHPWEAVVVAREGEDNRVAILSHWPRGLPALPPGVEYAPGERRRATPVWPRRRRLALRPEGAR